MKGVKAMNSARKPTILRILLLFSLAVAIISLISLAYLQVNISGDGVPNRPQGGPPVEYPWGQAYAIIVVVVLSIATAGYSWRRITIQNQ
ncbi:hypothetical protein A3K78_07540 [Candidatus Bathyarchaeota archaeon RBG_13_52_12]|nr:MAG: hypothetical protein A3K78_07540 [Candidatus Bathyarchaeota archaeon RBG_13_52_12]